MDFKLNLGHSEGGVPLTWENASNGHIALLGQSGRGKSYAVKNFLLQLPAQGVHAYVFDYSNDFNEENIQDFLHLNSVPITIRNVRQQARFDPFQPLQLSATYTEEREDTASRLASTILDAYQFKGNAQPVYLRKAISDFMKNSIPYPSFSELLSFIEFDEKRAEKMSPSLARLEDLARLFPSGETACNWGLNERGITILQFDTIPDQATQVLITELLLANLWAQKLQAKQESCPIVVLLDECQRLRFHETSMLYKILREGRKHHINGWFASQWIDNHTAIQALGQAALRAYFYPGDKNIRALARELCSNPSQIREHEALIRRLQVGQFLYADQNGRTLLNCVSKLNPERDNAKFYANF